MYRILLSLLLALAAFPALAQDDDAPITPEDGIYRFVDATTITIPEDWQIEPNPFGVYVFSEMTSAYVQQFFPTVWDDADIERGDLQALLTDYYGGAFEDPIDLDPFATLDLGEHEVTTTRFVFDEAGDVYEVLVYALEYGVDDVLLIEAVPVSGEDVTEVEELETMIASFDTSTFEPDAPEAVIPAEEFTEVVEFNDDTRLGYPETWDHRQIEAGTEVFSEATSLLISRFTDDIWETIEAEPGDLLAAMEALFISANPNVEFNPGNARFVEVGGREALIYTFVDSDATTPYTRVILVMTYGDEYVLRASAVPFFTPDLAEFEQVLAILASFDDEDFAPQP